MVRDAIRSPQEPTELIRVHEDIVPLNVEHPGRSLHRVNEPEPVRLEHLHLFGEDRRGRRFFSE
ncbi:hypothetical protein [Streptomyces wuyuanensis]|uniref:hypothetical protein n=1 Tax=Streptomyces wuyuanensis TaxID=1196353 RepID=UPI0037201709